MSKLPKTLSSRLTLWYTASFVLFLGIALSALYFSIDTILNKRIDEDLREDIEEFIVLYEKEGLESVKKEINREAKTSDISSVFIRLLDNSGKQIYTSDLTHWKGVHSIQTILNKVIDGKHDVWLETIEFSSQEDDTRVAYGLIGPNTILQIGESTEEKEEIMDLLLAVFTSLFFIAVPIASTIGWLMTKRGVKGIEKISNVAMDIRNGKFDQRVAIKNQPEEIQNLANTFNAMIERINSLISEMQEMIDNIAHDLRSPLARIRAISENVLSSNSEINDYKTALEDTLEECDRLIQMVNSTLDVAEAEAGVATRIKEDIDLTKLAEDACEIFEPIAEDKKIKLSFNAKENCTYYGNKQSLQRMLANLIDNAIKYSKSNSKVNIKLENIERNIIIKVADQGDGIAKDNQTRVFERFFRCDSSRGNSGNGLGLSYALAVVRSHGGDINLDSTPGSGSTFTISLPT